MPIILFLLLTLGAGTGVAAQGSLPGDVLYPVKIHINENIEALITVTSKGDAELALKQAVRRLEEAEKLKTEGALTLEKSIEIRNNFSREIESMNKRLVKMENEGDSKSVLEVNEKFEQKMDDHFNIFISISGDSTTTAPFFGIIRTREEKSEGDSSSNKNRQNRLDNDNNDEDRDRNEDEDENDEKNEERSLNITIPPVTTGTNSTNSSTTAKFTISEVAQHNSRVSCYTAINGSVYNLTTWIAKHPGGESSILGLCGIDGTTSFMAQHGGQGNPAQELASFKIGIVGQ